MTTKLIRKMVLGVFEHFFYSGERMRFFYFRRSSSSDRIAGTIQYKSKPISISSEASAETQHTHTDDQQ